MTLRVAAEDTTLNGAFVLSPLAINRGMGLWGADAEEFRPEQWASGEDGAAVVGSDYRFLTFLTGPWDALGMCLPKWSLSACLRLRLLRLGSPRNPKGVHPFRLRRWFRVNFSFTS